MGGNTHGTKNEGGDRKPRKTIRSLSNVIPNKRVGGAAELRQLRLNKVI